MVKAYPLHIRRKAVQMIVKQGLSITHVARIMQISRKTIYSWLDSKSTLPRGRPRKLHNLSDLSQLIIDQPQIRISEIAEKFQISRQTVYHYLRQLHEASKTKDHFTELKRDLFFKD